MDPAGQLDRALQRGRASGRQRVARLRGTRKLVQRFLHYVVASKAFTSHVLTIQTGTAVPHISGRDINAFEFHLPPLSEQKTIAAILGALDDKIELNRRCSVGAEWLLQFFRRDVEGLGVEDGIVNGSREEKGTARFDE